MTTDKPTHPDTLSSPDPIADAIFTKIMDAYTFEPEGQQLERLHTVAMAVNDPERPPEPEDITRHSTARHFGLDKVGHNTAILGEHNGFAYLDQDGDVFAAFITHPTTTNTPLGVCFVVDGRQAWLPAAVVVDLLERLNNKPISMDGAWDPMDLALSIDDVRDDRYDETDSDIDLADDDDYEDEDEDDD